MLNFRYPAASADNVRLLHFRVKSSLTVIRPVATPEKWDRPRRVRRVRRGGRESTLKAAWSIALRRAQPR